VDRDSAEHETLRARDVEVARADDLVDPGDRLGTERESADRLRAAGVEDRRYAREVRGRVNRVVRSVSGEGRRAGDLWHASDLRRHGGHENARRITRLATWRIDARAPHRQHAKAEPDAVGLELEARVSLTLVERANACGCVLQRAARVSRKTI